MPELVAGLGGPTADMGDCRQVEPVPRAATRPRVPVECRRDVRPRVLLGVVDSGWGGGVENGQGGGEAVAASALEACAGGDDEMLGLFDDDAGGAAESLDEVSVFVVGDGWEAAGLQVDAGSAGPGWRRAHGGGCRRGRVACGSRGRRPGGVRCWRCGRRVGPRRARHRRHAGPYAAGGGARWVRLGCRRRCWPAIRRPGRGLGR